MANKIDTAMDAMETALNLLVAAGTLKAVRRAILVAQNVPSCPVVCFLPMNVDRLGGSGAASERAVTVDVRIITRSKDSLADQTVSELIAAVETGLNTLADSSGGPLIEMPRWDFWYGFGAGGLVLQGAICRMRVGLSGPLAS